ncbi:MAG: SMI1/KNR4 family protein [Burkholderiales bacterium]|nr:SMI1/KNR4 family protein [Burkholderiales bacterium]
MSCTVFRHLAIEGAKPPPAEAQVRAIEDELGADLPASFRHYLDAANGGYLEYLIDVPPAAGRASGGLGEPGEIQALSFCSLFSADGGGSETFLTEMRSDRELTGLPPGVLPFARDGGGSVVHLDLRAAGKGRVVAFVQGRPAWAGGRRESALIELTPSFDDCVDRLRLDIDAALDHLQYDAGTLDDVAAIEQRLDIGLPAWRGDSSLMRAVESARARMGGRTGPVVDDAWSGDPS